MKSMLNTACVTAGAALILLTGCVSSKKYKASQADVAKLKNDSTQLAQQVSSLNTNVTDLQSKNTTLQGSLDKSNASYAAQQEHLNYYQNYFKDQQTAMNQVSDDLKGALTQAGVANADVEQVIYKARALHPEFPGIMDSPCWEIGRKYCGATKLACNLCYMKDLCPTAEGNV